MTVLGNALGALKNSAPVPLTTQRSSIVRSFARTRSDDYQSQMAIYGEVSTLFSVVNLLSFHTSTVDWKLYRKQTDARRVYGPDESERREVTVHAALNLWNNPNRFFTRQLFIETFQQHVELTGEADLVIARDSRFNVPVEIWPVRPDRIIPVPHPTEFLAGYVYLSPDGDKIPLDVNEVIRLKIPAPLDMYRGMGPVAGLMIDLQSMRQAALWNHNFFVNSAEPGGVIEVPEELEDPEFNRMRDRWNEQHKGVSRAHRVAILEAGAKWVERSYSQKDMQWVELRRDGRDLIREAFGVHKHMLGMSDDVNRANAEAAEVVHARWKTVPRLERIKGMLNSQFLPLFVSGENVEFDYCNPVPEDREADNAERESKARAWAIYVQQGMDAQFAAELVGIGEIEMAAIQAQQVPAIAPGTDGRGGQDESMANARELAAAQQ